MAGDWIKWCKGLCRKREVQLLASQLKRDRHEIAGRLMTLWEWCDDNITDNEFDANETASIHVGDDAFPFLDALLGLPGMADALASPDVGWLIQRSGGRIAFPNLGRHNGGTAKTRSLESRKKQRQRSASKAHTKCPDSNGTRAGPEKRREENKEIKKESDKFVEFWSVYPKRERKAEALKCWNARIREGVPESDLLAAAKTYAVVCEKEKREPKFIMQPTTFLGPNQRFADWVNVSQSSSQRPSDWHKKAGKPVSEMTAEEKNLWKVPVGM